VAIVQISRITNRKGLQVNLPQLAGAELGWSIDARRLYIGNGTLAEGAPVVGNTEILTEFSDILELQTTYTYKGEAAGYTVQTGPTADDPVTQSLQSWLDQFATIKDFGAVGDGITDDTEAINRALFQLYCREVNPQIRRSLFFPAGVYRVTETIFIPPYATLYGEGLDASIIQLDNSGDDSTLNAFVARTCDSLQQYGANIGSNDATPPQSITITDMAFNNQDPTTDVFLVQDASLCRFERVGFYGPLQQTDLTTEFFDTAGVRFASSITLVTTAIVFDNCDFLGTTFGINTATSLVGDDQLTQAVTVQNSEFSKLYQGIVLGSRPLINGGTTGFKIIGNAFDEIYAEGVYFGSVALNATGHNVFYGVGNHFGPLSTPFTGCIAIQGSDNISIGDLFARPDQFAQRPVPGSNFPTIAMDGISSIATVNGSKMLIGTYIRDTGQRAALLANQLSPTPLFTLNSIDVSCFQMNYAITRGSSRRIGVLTAASDLLGAATSTDSFTENVTTGILLFVTQSGSTITVSYTSTAGSTASISYSLTYLPT
jgi:Pectate lyase superfamily protein